MSNPSPAIERKSPNKSATRVSTGRIRRNTKDPFPLLSEPFSPTSTDASGQNNIHAHTHTHTQCVHVACLQLCPRGTGVFGHAVACVWMSLTSGRQSRDRRQQRRSQVWRRDVKVRFLLYNYKPVSVLPSLSFRHTIMQAHQSIINPTNQPPGF